MVDFGTKYWVVVIVLALILLAGTGALSVWICKIYDTQKTQTLAPGISPFPDVVPVVTPPTTDPTLNMCYKWCDGVECPNNVTTTCGNNDVCVKPTTCSTNLDCQNACSLPNNVTSPAVCTNSVCSPPYQKCITGFSEPSADPTNLKKCISSNDCNVCTDTPTGEAMSCVFVQDNSTLNLCDGNCEIKSVPQGYYCLPERTGCDAKAGTATWTSEGWQCTCRWPEIMGGPECNILLACGNNKVRDDTKALQQLIVNCTDTNNPFCGKPWTPESDIDPTACYSKSKGFATVADCEIPNPNPGASGQVPNPDALPNCVCQCEGLDKESNRGYTYDLSDPHTCVLDPCNTGAWGRTLVGDAGYLLNAVPGVIHDFKLIAPVSVQNQYLSLAGPNSPLSLSADNNTKFEMLNWGTPEYYGVLKAYQKQDINQYAALSLLSTNEDGSQVGTQDYLPSVIVNAERDSQKWVLKRMDGYPQSVDNLDNLVMYNPVWNRPTGAQFTDPAYNDTKRYLLYNADTKIFLLGPLVNNPANVSVVVMQRVGSSSMNTSQGAVLTDYIPQPLTNCACSGANSVSSVKACYDSNDNFVDIVSLMNESDLVKCDGTYSRYISAVCDPYILPNGVVTIQPSPESQMLCKLYKDDLSTLKFTGEIGNSTNLLPFKSGFVPGLNIFIDPITGQEELKSICTADPCTGRSGDAAYSVQNNSGYWDAINGTCSCINGNIADPSQNYYPFSVDNINQIWNKNCKTDTTSTACVCNHITNPVCAICQNACQGNTFCKSSPQFPCKNGVVCDTSPETGGPACVCTGNCILQSGTKNLCMGRIPTGGLCAGVEGQAGVCITDGDTCKKMFLIISEENPENGKQACVQEEGASPTISYCTSSTDDSCFDSTYPYNYLSSGCGYDNCPVPS